VGAPLFFSRPGKNIREASAYDFCESVVIF